MEELEKEEQLRQEAGYYAVPKMEIDDTLLEIRSLARKIRERKAIMRQETRVETSSKPTIPRTAPARARDRSVVDLRDKMEDLGVTMTGTDDVSHFVLLIYFAMYKNR